MTWARLVRKGQGGAVRCGVLGNDEMMDGELVMSHVSQRDKEIITVIQQTADSRSVNYL